MVNTGDSDDEFSEDTSDEETDAIPGISWLPEYDDAGPSCAPDV